MVAEARERFEMSRARERVETAFVVNHAFFCKHALGLCVYRERRKQEGKACSGSVAVVLYPGVLLLV